LIFFAGFFLENVFLNKVGNFSETIIYKHAIIVPTTSGGKTYK